MVSAASPAPRPRWHKAFLALLPAILRHAKLAFAYLKPEARSEAVAEVVANACQAYARLVELGKTDIAYATALARYGVKQTRDHRKVGGHLNIRDVLSKYCQNRKGLVVERLDHFDEAENAWQEILIEDKHADAAAIVQTKLDMGAWLDSLKRRDRRVAEFLAKGETTKTAARKFRVSQGRISQLRRELATNYRAFVGDDPGPANAA
jgi:DNA-binding NarL/FixJ family response regulator